MLRTMGWPVVSTDDNVVEPVGDTSAAMAVSAHPRSSAVTQLPISTTMSTRLAVAAPRTRMVTGRSSQTRWVARVAVDRQPLGK